MSKFHHSVKSTLTYLIPILITLFLAACDGGNSAYIDRGYAPVANAGKDQSTSLNKRVVLNGSQSSDDDGDKLLYHWVMLDKPKNSQAKLSKTDSVEVSFTPDIAGKYSFQLIVNDGKTDSQADIVEVIVKATTSQICSPNKTEKQNCSIANGSGSQTRVCATDGLAWGSYDSCEVSSCNTGYHKEGNTCVVTPPSQICTPNSIEEKSCTIVDGSGKQSRRCAADGLTWGAYKTCEVSSCNTGYHKLGNVCKKDLPSQLCIPKSTEEKVCTIANGSGTQTKTCAVDGLSWSAYKACEVSSCDVGYHKSNNTCIKDNPKNSPPTVKAGDNQTITEGSKVTLTAIASDSDGTIVSQKWSENNKTLGSELIVELAGLSLGKHILTISVTDNDGAIAKDSVIITVKKKQNTPPVANAQTLNTDKDKPIALVLSGTDQETKILTYTILTPPKNGKLTGTAPNLTYTPNSGYNGTDSFTFKVNDGELDSVVGMISITVNAINHPPKITSIPTSFVLEGNDWNYKLVAIDSDGDDVIYKMDKSPIGATINAQTGEVLWKTNGVTLGNYEFIFTAEDQGGLKETQKVSIEVMSKSRSNTHVGTEFWLPFTKNNKAAYKKNTYYIYLVSQHANTVASLEVSALGISEEIDLTAGEVTEYIISSSKVFDAGAIDDNKILVGKSVHITSKDNISVYMLNQKTYSTDGYLALPTSSWGKSHIVGHYRVYGPSGVGLNRDPIVGIIAAEDNTVIKIKPTMDLFFLANIKEHGYKHIKTGEIFTLTLDAGQVYNLETGGSASADLTGTLIESTKPIGVLGEHPCAAVPMWQACDHLIEQLPPIESLATKYITAPFSGRKADAFRIIAPFDNTDIYINGALRNSINSQRYYEFQAADGQVIETSHPVLVLQYENGSAAGKNTLPSGYADPFMVVVPPAEQYLKEYTVSTPADKLELNFVNVIIPTSASNTLYQDENLVDSNLFKAIENSSFSYAQLEVSHGAHHFKSDTPFGLYVYGNDLYETYGYLGGMAFSLPDAVSQITLSSPNSKPLGEELCITANVKNNEVIPVYGVRLKFLVSGSNKNTDYVFSDASGLAQFCYKGTQIGEDTITVSIGDNVSKKTVNWVKAQGNLPPRFVSRPNLLSAVASDYQYQIQAIDPEGGSLSFKIIEGHSRMTIDDNGLLKWRFVTFDLDSIADYIPQVVVIEVKDDKGATARQKFAISFDYPPENVSPQSHMLANYSNTPPVFEVKSKFHDVRGKVGVPYVYNTNGLKQLVTDYPFYIRYRDHDGDAADITLKNAPDGAYLDCYNPYTSQHPIWCTRRLRWIPSKVGNYQFEIHMRDARGVDAKEIQHFNVDVSPNLPPKIISNPPTKAVVGQKYFYALEIENDVPYNFKHNLDNLKVIIEDGPRALIVNKASIDKNLKGRMYLTWTPRESEIGIHNIKIRVDDRVNSSMSQEFTIEVVNDNQVPVITSKPITRAEVSIPYNYQVIANDPEGQLLSYRLLTKINGMKINDTGLITWTPTEAQLEIDYRAVWVEVSDTSGGHAVQKYYIRINHFINQGPIFTSAYRPATAKVGVEYTHQLEAIDREGETFTYKLFNPPTGMTIDQQGLLRWTPTSTGVFYARVIATDASNVFTVESWKITVTNLNGSGTLPPILAPSLKWIETQAQADGSYTNNAKITIPWQSTSEVLRAYQKVGEVLASGVAPAKSYLNNQDDTKIEVLSRKIILGIDNGVDVSPLITRLILLQNIDGGFGDQGHYHSRVIDTAFALQALGTAKFADNTFVNKSVKYLKTQQSPEGGFSHSSTNKDSIYETALVSLALQQFQNSLNLSAMINTSNQYLMDNQAAGGAWDTHWESALALLAIEPTAANKTAYKAAAEKLKVAQLSNGSWNNEVYATALAIRAIFKAENLN